MFLGVQQFFSYAEFGLGSNGAGIPDLGFCKEFTASALGFNGEYDNNLVRGITPIWITYGLTNQLAAIMTLRR
ncbi:hypothetical protein ST37_14835 [Vibrio sp. qd031]|nr:hypothetical protein ST37_14835 [Vibrio sp. qd031]